MFTASNAYLSFLKSEFPQASDFRFEYPFNGPQIHFMDGRRERVEYVPVLCWKVGSTNHCWSPDPRFKTRLESFPLVATRERTYATYDHAFSEAQEAIRASIEGTTDEFNKSHVSKYPLIDGRQVRF